jgi:CheY-like chemotaxis protein
MSKTILLVEDSRDDELLFKRILRVSGLENPVFVVRDGDDAIAYLKGAGKYSDRETFPIPAIMFLDLRMPKADGCEVLKYILSQPALRNKMLRVVLTNFGETRNVAEAYSLGAQSFLTKPLTKDEMKNLITHFRAPWILSSEGAE